LGRDPGFGGNPIRGSGPEIRVFAGSRVWGGFSAGTPGNPENCRRDRFLGFPGGDPGSGPKSGFWGVWGDFPEKPRFLAGTPIFGVGTDFWVRDPKFRFSAEFGVWGGFFAGTPGNPEKWLPGSPIRGSGRGSGRGTEKSDFPGSGRVEKCPQKWGSKNPRLRPARGQILAHKGTSIQSKSSEPGFK